MSGIAGRGRTLWGLLFAIATVATVVIGSHAYWLALGDTPYPHRDAGSVEGSGEGETVLEVQVAEVSGLIMRAYVDHDRESTSHYELLVDGPAGQGPPPSRIRPKDEGDRHAHSGESGATVLWHMPPDGLYTARLRLTAGDGHDVGFVVLDASIVPPGLDSYLETGGEKYWFVDAQGESHWIDGGLGPCIDVLTCDQSLYVQQALTVVALACAIWSGLRFRAAGRETASV